MFDRVLMYQFLCCKHTSALIIYPWTFIKKKEKKKFTKRKNFII